MTPEGAEITLRMYEGALRSVDARVRYRKACTAAAGVPEEEYQAMTLEQKEAAIGRGRRILQKREAAGA